MKTVKHLTTAGQAEGSPEVLDIYKLFFLTNYFNDVNYINIEDELDLVDLSLEWDV